MDIRQAAWSNAGVVAAMVEEEIGHEISVSHDEKDDVFVFMLAKEQLYFYYMTRNELLLVNLDILAKTITTTWKGPLDDYGCRITQLSKS